MTDSTSTHQSEAEAPRNGSRRRLAVGILLVSVLLMLAAGAWWWHQLQTTVSTDNAKVTGDITDISPKTGGRLEELLVAEGDQVRAGQLLARLDSSQAEVALAQAQAALALAEANLAKLPDEVRAARATVERNRQTAAAARAQVGVAETTLADSTRALQQAQALFDSGAVSREALDSATSRQRSARAALEAAQANAAAASASLEESLARLDSISRTGAPLYQAQVESARAAVKSAQLAWDNTMVKAPVGGTVVRIAAQTGENVAAGQTLLTLVDLETTWVVANIDEGKIGRIRPGQEVEVRIDAYPGRKLKGRVAEVGAATQSTFALIPAENTSGNYTKVSQRVPIRIRVERNGLVLKPGMSAVVKIHTGTDR